MKSNPLPACKRTGRRITRGPAREGTCHQTSNLSPTDVNSFSYARWALGEAFVAQIDTPRAARLFIADCGSSRAGAAASASIRGPEREKGDPRLNKPDAGPDKISLGNEIPRSTQTRRCTVNGLTKRTCHSISTDGCFPRGPARFLFTRRRLARMRRRRKRASRMHLIDQSESNGRRAFATGFSSADAVPGAASLK